MPLYLSRKTLNQNDAMAAGAATQPLLDDVTRQYEQAISPPQPESEEQPQWSLPSLQSLGVQDAPSAVMSAIGAMPQRARETAQQATDAVSWALPSLESLGVSQEKPWASSSGSDAGSDQGQPPYSTAASLGQNTPSEMGSSSPTASMDTGSGLPDTSSWRGGGAPRPEPQVSTPSAPTGEGGLRGHAERMAQKYGLDWNVFDRQLNQESGYSTTAVSSAGARGPGQFMPATGAGVARQLGVTPEQFWASPELQVEGAALHMRDLLRANGNDYRMALAAYNAGQGNVDKYGEGVFGADFANGQTRDYVNIILGPGAANRRVSMTAGTAEGPAGAQATVSGRGLAAADRGSPDPLREDSAEPLMLRGPLQPNPGRDTFETEDGSWTPESTSSSTTPPMVDTSGLRATPLSPPNFTASPPVSDPTASDLTYTQSPTPAPTWQYREIEQSPEALGPTPPDDFTIPPPSPYAQGQAESMEPAPERFSSPEPTQTRGVLGTLYDAGQKSVEAGLAASGPPESAMDVAQNALPSARGQRIVQDAIDAFGTEVGRQVAASLGYTDEEMFTIFGMPVSAKDVGGLVGSTLLDPTNLIPGGQAAAVGRVGVRAAQEGLEAAGRGARELGTRVTPALRELGAEAAYQLMDLAPSPRVIQPGGGGIPTGPLRGQQPTREIEQALVSDYGRKYPPIKGRIDGNTEQSLGTPSAEFIRDSRFPRDAVHPDIADNVTGPLDQPPNMAGRMNATPGIAPRTGASILEQAAADAGSALGSSVFGAAAGLAAPAETDEERAQNARIGAAIGLVGGPVASRVLRSRGGALATPGFGPRDTPGLGNVPPSRLSEPTLPGFEPPYRRPDLPDISDAPNRPRLPGEDPAGRQSELFETSGLIPTLQRGLQDPRPPGWNPSEVSDAIRQAQEEARVRADKGEAISPLEWTRRLAAEIGYSSMIGPATFTVNLTGNILEPLWSIPKEAARAVVRGAPGEFFQMAGGAFHGMRQVGSAMVDALTASGRYAPTPGHAPLSAVTSNPIGRAITTGLEAGGRVFSALPDAVFGTIAQGAGEARAAAQMATDQGLKGAQWRKYVNDLLSDVEHVKAGELPSLPGTQQVIDEGAAYAKRQTFQDELGTIGKNVRDFATLAVIPDGQGGRKPIPVLGNLITPFFNTPWNMSTRMFERTPVGVVMNSQGSRFDKAYDATIGSALLIGLAAGPVASGAITGGGPQDPEKKSEMRSQGWRPYSTLIDGVYIPNRVFGIYAPLLNAAADVHDAIVYAKDKTPGSITSDYVGRIGQQLQQQPYLQGISSIMQAIQAGQGGGLGAAAERYAASTITRMVPYAATGRTIGTMLDPNERTVDQGKNVPASTTIGQMVRSGIGNRQGFEQIGQGPLPIPQDVLGRPQENQQQGARALFARTSEERPDPTIKAFMDAGVDIGFPKTKLSVDSIPIDLTPEETKRWQAYRGEILQRFGANMTQRAFWANPEARQAAMQDLLQQANAAADQKLLQSIGAPDIRRRVTESRQKQREQLLQGVP